MLENEERQKSRGQSRAPGKDEGADQSDSWQKWSAVARILIAEQQQTQPATDHPQQDRSPFFAEPSSQKDYSCDEGHKQREEELITFKCPDVEHNCCKTHAFRVTFENTTGRIER